MPRRFLIGLTPLLTAALASNAGAQPCSDAEARIDSAPDQNAQVNVCPCFAPGEVAMTILDVPPGGTAVLQEIRIFWKSFIGPQPDSLESAVIVYDMNQSGPADPSTFVPLCTEQEGCILEGPVMQDGGLNAFDVSPLNIELPPGRFGIGLEFLTDQSAGNPLFIPSVAGDNDGHNNAGGVVRNWVLVNGVSWQSSQSLGVSGDWIIRAIGRPARRRAPGTSRRAGATVRSGSTTSCRCWRCGGRTRVARPISTATASWGSSTSSSCSNTGARARRPGR